MKEVNHNHLYHSDGQLKKYKHLNQVCKPQKSMGEHTIVIDLKENVEVSLRFSNILGPER